jgi:hypothetical protein
LVASHLISTQLHVMQFVTHLWFKLLLFIRYLSIARDKEMKPGVKEGVDTLLLKLYAQLENTEQLKLLTASPNSCVLQTKPALEWMHVAKVLGTHKAAGG